MRSPPPGLAPEHLADVLADGWGFRGLSLEYVPEGGGSHHWTLTDADGRRRFVTVDDLDNKEWIGRSREVVFDGLRSALSTAAVLRYDTGLQFVVAPIAAVDGQPLRRVGCGTHGLRAAPSGGQRPRRRCRAASCAERLPRPPPAVLRRTPRPPPDGLNGTPP